ncbi:MAG TPA: CopD family protein [Stellaceae bacterium]|nr:CopD family protein [Stellaceae bacterium]
MSDPMVAIRAVHYASTLFAAGALAFDTLLLGASRVRHRRAIAAAAALALISALLWLWFETARIAGGAPTPGLALRVLSATEFGHAWSVRLVLLALWLAAILCARGRGMLIVAAALGIGAAASLAFSGHAAAEGARGLALDMVHLTAASLWLGALLPFALLCNATRAGTNAALAEAARAARRFSPLGLICVGALLLTGGIRAWGLVGTIPGLIGTPYGQLLSIKIVLFLVMVALAAINRQRLTPALATVHGREAARRLMRSALVEAALGLMILVDVGALGIGVPAAHDQPIWPFPVTWTLAAIGGKPGVQVLTGAAAALASLGIAALLVAVMRARWRWFALGLPALALGLLIAGDALSIDAQPTMYQSSPLPFDVETIAAGAPLYRDNCAQCHGRYGYGDGANAPQLAVKPADLARVHVAHHSDGSLFWWVRHGKGEGAMPAFADLLSEEQAWDLVAYLRALSDSVAAKNLGPSIDPQQRVPAPAFSFERGEAGQERLEDLAGRQAVLLVLYTLPESAPRLAALADAAPALEAAGLAVVALPLGDQAEGTGSISTPADPDLTEVYALFRRLDAEDTFPKTAPSEFLIDRWGYLRARFLDGATASPDQLRAMVAAMAQEPQPPPANAAMHHH